MVTAHKPWWDSWANSWPQEKHGIMTPANNPFQLTIVPCFPPLNGRGTLLNYYFSNPGGSAALINLWDQYIADPTTFTSAGTVGSNSAPCWQVNLPANGDVMAVCNTEKRFQTGIAGQANVDKIFYSVQLAITALG